MKITASTLLLLAAMCSWSAPVRGQSLIRIQPDTINFGRVRIGQDSGRMFTITNANLPGNVTLDSLNYQKHVKNMSDFTIYTLNGSAGLYPLSTSVTDIAHFHPIQERRDTERIPIHYVNETFTDSLYLIGQGVTSRITSVGYDFGTVRVDSTRTDSIAIVNAGGDVTIIDSVTIAGASDTTDFDVRFDSLPPHGRNDTLAFEGKRSTLYVPVRFRPRSLGKDSLVLRIHTTAGQVIFDILRGTGVEPLVTMAPATIDFRTDTVKGIIPGPIDTFFTISNTGTMAGHLNSLFHSDTTHFRLDTVVAKNRMLDTGSSLIVYDTFVGTDEGDFTDSVYLTNDTRYRLYGDSMANYQPVIIQKASVRTAPLTIAQVFFDTVRTCDTIRHDIVIHNPFPISISIDTITFDSTAAGLTSDPNHPHGSKIIIPADSEYTLHLAYNFPPDSLNGLQQMKMNLIERHADGAPTIGVATALVYRLRQELTLYAQLPTFVSSANDVDPLRLPITIKGFRAGVRELDDWTLALTFSNDLFEPIGVDTSGGLVTAHDSTPFSLVTAWDQSTRTYTITVRGAKLSDPNSVWNHLLFNVKMRAFLTTDTAVTVTPTFTFVTHPCAYNLHPFSLAIPYANDCGDLTLRTFLLGEAEPFRITGLWPDPASAEGVSLGYDAMQAMNITATTSNAAGNVIGTHCWRADVGSATHRIPAGVLPHSGVAYLTLEARSLAGDLLGRSQRKLEIEK